MTTSVYEFEAPQFIDFKNSGLDDSDEADKFFDVNEETPVKDENKENNSSNISIKSETDVLVGKDVINVKSNNDKFEGTTNKLREVKKAVRRLSSVKMENQSLGLTKEKNEANIEDNLSQDLSNINLKSRKRTHFDGIVIKPDCEKEHSMVTRNDEKIKTPKIELRTRSVIKNSDKKNLKRKSTFAEEIKAPGKYMAMAEHILHFQQDTPPRFHTRKREFTGINNDLLKKRQSYKPRRTIALTPKLMTSLRSRPVDAPTQDQREEMELEEMKKHQIKANPLNERIFLPPKLPPKPEKPKIVSAPFKLTQLTKKATQNLEDEPYRFTANPVPKAILEKPVGVAPKKERPITVPESPAITKPAWAFRRERVAVISNKFEESTEVLTSIGVPIAGQLKSTEVKPFSFEARDKAMLEKKEKKIKEVLEAEKRMREFKANPVPSFVASKDTTKSTVRSNFNCSKVSMKSVPESEEQHKTFKARSPRVLRKEPFRPVIEHAHSEPVDIQLHTDLRAEKRQQFEQKVAEKQEEIAGLKQMMEMMKKEQEEAEIARLRKEAVHKAQPMPKFKPVMLNEKVTSSLPLTNPQSPKFTKRSRATTMCSSSLVQK